MSPLLCFCLHEVWPADFVRCQFLVALHTLRPPASPPPSQEALGRTATLCVFVLTVFLQVTRGVPPIVILHYLMLFSFFFLLLVSIFLFLVIFHLSFFLLVFFLSSSADEGNLMFFCFFAQQGNLSARKLSAS